MQTSRSRKRARFSLYSVYQWLVYVPLVALATLAGALGAIILARLISPRAGSMYMAVPWCRLVAALVPVRVSVEGRENIEPGRSYIVVSNHQSQFDIPVIYGFSGLDLCWVMKAELKRVPLIAQGCRAIGHVFVDRSEPDQARAEINRLAQRLQEGTGILFFAEGTRSRTGKLLPFKKGAFRVAIDRQLPVLPVTVIGTSDILPPASLRVRPGRARLIIHTPISTAGLDAEDINCLRARVYAIIDHALKKGGR